MCLEDTETLQLLVSAAEDFARARVPREVSECFMLASMTALQKRGGGVRGIATGTSFRRVVAKTLARQFAQEQLARLFLEFGMTGVTSQVKSAVCVGA